VLFDVFLSILESSPKEDGAEENVSEDVV